MSEHPYLDDKDFNLPFFMRCLQVTTPGLSGVEIMTSFLGLQWEYDPDCKEQIPSELAWAVLADLDCEGVDSIARINALAEVMSRSTTVDEAKDFGIASVRAALGMLSEQDLDHIRLSADERDSHFQGPEKLSDDTVLATLPVKFLLEQLDLDQGTLDLAISDPTVTDAQFRQLYRLINKI